MASSCFHQQAAGDESVDWSHLNPVMFMARSDHDKARCCTICPESDHTEEYCDLYSSPVKPYNMVKWAGYGCPAELREMASTSHGKGPSRLACFLSGIRVISDFPRADTAIYVSGVLAVHHISPGYVVSGNLPTMKQKARTSMEGHPEVALFTYTEYSMADL